MSITYEHKYDVTYIYNKFKKNRVNAVSYLGTSNNGKLEPDSSAYLSYENLYVNNYTYDKATIDQKIGEGGIFDPTQYYTTAQTYSKTEVDSLIPTVPTNVSDFVNDAGYLTSHQPIKTINGNVLVGNGNVQLDIPKIWHGTKAEYEFIETKDADTIYLIYEN